VALPIVALVGRPNVGKSTLFNRLVGRSEAITADEPGVTRDRRYGRVEWAQRSFLLVDMGGLDPLARSGMGALVRAECEAAIVEADLVVLVLDGQEGLVPMDREVARRLRRSGKPTLAAVNKVDAAAHEAAAAEVAELGLASVAVSAAHGRNTAELLDQVLARLPEAEAAPEAADADRIRLLLVGSPNVGKSSLLNRLLGRMRALVHDQPGTTRDPVDAPIDHPAGRFLLVDTAGIRRHRAVDHDPERFSVLRAIARLSQCDVAVLVVDASRGVAQQEARIAALCEERGCGLLVVLNKWDLCEGDPLVAEREARRQVEERLGFVGHPPVLFVSARSGAGAGEILPRARAVQDERMRRIGTAEVNRLIEEAVARRPPPSRSRGRPLRIYYGAQVESGPPRFVLSCNAPAEVPEAYRRYLVNRLRERFGFVGTPLRLGFRSHREARAQGQSRARRGPAPK
jgi:GTPase